MANGWRGGRHRTATAARRATAPMPRTPPTPTALSPFQPLLLPALPPHPPLARCCRSPSSATVSLRRRAAAPPTAYRHAQTHHGNTRVRACAFAARRDFAIHPATATAIQHAITVCRLPTARHIVRTSTGYAHACAAPLRAAYHVLPGLVTACSHITLLRHLRMNTSDIVDVVDGRGGDGIRIGRVLLKPASRRSNIRGVVISRQHIKLTSHQRA